MAILGIDLGTSNSAAALLRVEDKQVVVVEPSEGRSDYAYVFPSYVAFDAQGSNTAVGLWAKERYRQGEFVIRHFKRLMGRTYDYVAKEIARGNRSFIEFKDIIERGPAGEVLLKAGSRKFKVEEVAALLLKKIREEAEAMAQKRWGEHIDEVTISIPAAWDDDQRRATTEAAKLAGFPGIRVIEEPRAAAIAWALLNEGEGNIAVIDIGAGTSDIVVGRVTKIGERISPKMTTRKSDDVLGGMDMDYLLLLHVLKEDKSEPRLADVYPRLDREEKSRLMAKIEDAKILASLEGESKITMTLHIGEGKKKRLSMTLDEKILNSTIYPLIIGYDTDDKLFKGIKPLVENTLKEVAGNDGKIEEVKQQIQKLILVGGPCRLGLIHEMLKELFQGNDIVCKDLAAIDPWDTFFMESVAMGAALRSLVEDSKIPTPYPISFFHWQNGRTPIIPKGIPYDPEQGITRTIKVPVHHDSNLLYVINEKDKDQTPPSKWTMRSHTVKVPEKGEIEITLHWSEAGTESSKSSIRGAGLSEEIHFPESKDITTIGESLERSFKRFLWGAKNLRQRIEEYRGDPCKNWFRSKLSEIGQGNPSDSKIAKICQEMLHVPEMDLQKCETIDPETAFQLTEEDVEYALQEGYFKPRDNKWAPECGMSKRAVEVLNLTFVIEEGIIVPVNYLIGWSMMLLEKSQTQAENSDFYPQMARCLEKMKNNPNRSNCAGLANTLSALATYLHNSGVIDGDLYRKSIFIADHADCKNL